MQLFLAKSWWDSHLVRNGAGSIYNFCAATRMALIASHSELDSTQKVEAIINYRCLLHLSRIPYYITGKELEVSIP